MLLRGSDAAPTPGEGDPTRREPSGLRRRVRAGVSALLLAVFVITAAGSSLYFSREQDRAAEVSLVLYEIQVELGVQNSVEGRAGSGLVHPDVSRASVERSVRSVDDLLTRVADLGGDPIDVAELRVEQRRYRDLVLSEIGLIERGELELAAQLADDQVDPAFDAVEGHVTRVADEQDRHAADARRRSDLGMVLSIAVALIGNSVLQRRLRVEEVRREQARATEARYRSLVDRSADLVVVSDTLGRLDYLSPAAERILGVPEESGSAPRRLHDGIHEEDHEIVDSLLRAPDEGVRDVRLNGADGQVRNFQVQARDLTEDRSVGGVVLTFHDVTDQRELEAELTMRALHDPLTGLPNRSLFTREIQRGLGSMRRGDDGLAVLLIDLDRFKEINDTLGHHVGDEVLSQIGPRLRHVLRSHDTLARLGGDEFAVLLPGVKTEAAGELVARKILASLDEPFLIHDIDLHVEASIGVVVAGEHGTDEATLMQRADVAMYVAKRKGTGSCVYAPEIDTNSRERLSVLSELREALAAGQLVMHYQPLITLATGEVQAVEALIRWNHPERGLVLPGDFVPAAEQTGLVVPMTRHVIDQCLAQAARWHRSGRPLQVSANVSARNIADSRLVDDVAELLLEHGVPPELLRLEITESAIVADTERSADVLTAIRQLGVTLAVDDFGAGHTSFAQLQSLPVSELKIDRSYVSLMNAQSSSDAIVRSLVDLGRNLGLEVTAEGVESLEVIDDLAAAGCERAQGYHFTPALPAVALDAWLEAWDPDSFLARVRSRDPLGQA